MLCPKCNKGKIRGSKGSCPECGYRTVMPVEKKMNERIIVSCIRKATRKDAGYATPEQVYAAYAYRMYTERKIFFAGEFFWFGLLLLCFCIAVILAELVPWKWFFLFVGVAFVLLRLGLYFLNQRPNRQGSILRKKDFLGALRTYCAARPQERVLTEPSLHTPPPKWEEDDIYDYGAKGILVVDRDLLVDFFVRNGFHRDKGIVVVSETGYPSYIAERCRKLRKEYPEMPVGWLHSSLPPAEARERLAGIQAAYGPHVLDLGEETAPKLAPFWNKIKGGEEVPPDSLGYTRLAGATAGALLAGLAIPAFLASPAWSGGASSFPGEGASDGSDGHAAFDHHDGMDDSDDADGTDDSDGDDGGDGFGDGGDGGDGGDFG